MADIEFPTTNITLYDEAGNPVAVTFVDGKYRLAVDAEITGFSVIADVRTLEQKLADDGKLFAASTDLISLGGGSGSETPFILIKNPVDSDVLMRLFQVALRLHTTSSFSVVVRIYLNPTVTDDGTGLLEHDENSAIDNTPAGIITLNPTVTDNGTFHQAYAASDATSLELNYNLSKIIGEGQDILITYEKSSGASVNIVSTLHWGEEATA